MLSTPDGEINVIPSPTIDLTPPTKPDPGTAQAEGAATPPTVTPEPPQVGVEPPITPINGSTLQTPSPLPVPPPKHPGGRPCIYCQRKEEIQKTAEEYIEKARSTQKPYIPYKEELAMIVGVDDETLGLWAVKKKEETVDGVTTTTLEHPEFSVTIKRLMTLQKLLLLKRTIGRFNPTGAIFQLKVNHGAIETEKKVLAGDKDEPLEVRIVEDKPREEPDE
jgi:hypothetical protein